MKYITAILFYISIGVTLGAVLGLNLRSFDSMLVIGGIFVGAWALISLLMSVISQRYFPFLKLNLVVIAVSLCLAFFGTGYLIIEKKELFLLLLTIGIPSSVFFACIMIFSVVFGVERSKKQIPLEVFIPEIKEEKPAPPPKKAPVKYREASLLRNVDEIRKYSAKKKEKEEGEGEEEEET